MLSLLTFIRVRTASDGRSQTVNSAATALCIMYVLRSWVGETARQGRWTTVKCSVLTWVTRWLSRPKGPKNMLKKTECCEVNWSRRPVATHIIQVLPANWTWKCTVAFLACLMQRHCHHTVLHCKPVWWLLRGFT